MMRPISDYPDFMDKTISAFAEIKGYKAIVCIVTNKLISIRNEARRLFK